ncbi:MAG: indole-3-glycerol phosphate synthase TrpC [Prevotella sp.]|nr:indole-3-glycerol phosphate synthase TrpC [Prevotella sp.]
MKDVLEEIVAYKRVEVERFKEVLAPHDLYRRVERMMLDEQNAQEKVSRPSMRQALIDSPTGIIAEFKRRSPSKGWIKEEGDARVIPLSYQQHGATALSILTDAHFFGGADDFIMAARESGVNIPVLYKNFVIDEYQLFQARLCGASAVLLIAADLSLDACRTLLRTAHELELEVLLEMHAERELDYAALEPDMYGINNRNLGTFTTDVENSFRMAPLLPKDVCKVSESGISNPATVRSLQMAGFHGFLIGENFMKADVPGEELRAFIAALEDNAFHV